MANIAPFPLTSLLLLGALIAFSQGQLFGRLLGAAKQKMCESTLEAPRLEVQLTPDGNRSVPVGTRVKLSCAVFGSPQATIRWEHNGKPIHTGDDQEGAEIEKLANLEQQTPQVQIGTTMSVLVVGCMSAADVGRYTCVGDNDCTQITADVELSIDSAKAPSIKCPKLTRRSAPSVKGEPAQITMWTDTRMERADAAVQLFCRAKGYPKPKVTWEVQDVTDDKYTPLTEDNTHFELHTGDLLVMTTEAGAGGNVYRCTASNALGQDSIESVLIEVDVDKK